MLAVSVSILGVLAILVAGEVLWRKKILRGENQRKFVHMSVGTFVAFWPWLMSWQSIRLIGAAMLVTVIANRRLKTLHYLGGIRRKQDYSDVFLALAVIVCAIITKEPIFFALAILQASLADGAAALVGKNFGREWRYKVFGREKTVLGTMAFWFVSLCILGVGILSAYDTMTFFSYSLLLLLLPPILTLTENIAAHGLDNLAVPIITIYALQLAQSLP